MNESGHPWTIHLHAPVLNGNTTLEALYAEARAELPMTLARHGLRVASPVTVGFSPAGEVLVRCLVEDVPTRTVARRERPSFKPVKRTRHAAHLAAVNAAAMRIRSASA